MIWNDNPSDEERIKWFVELYEVCQVPEAARLLRASAPVGQLSLAEAQRLVGATWHAMQSSFSRRAQFEQAFEFAHRLTSRAIVTRFGEGIPFIDATIEEPWRYFQCLSGANRLIGRSDDKTIESELRLDMIAFAQILLKEGVVGSVTNQLLAYVRAGHDFKNADIAKAFVDPGYLVDGKEILRSERRSAKIPEILLGRLRNTIAHGRFVYNPVRRVIWFQDVSKRDTTDVYEAEISYDGFTSITKDLYMRAAIATAYLTWLQIWTMTIAQVTDVFDLGAARVRGDILPP